CRLEVVVADDTAHTVNVMFNDTTTELLKCSAESFMGTKDENSDVEDELNLLVAIRHLIGADHVLEIKSHTYYEYGSFESFNCWKIIPNASAKDGASSNTAALTVNDVEWPVKIVTKAPTVCTPLKPNEGKKQKGHALEDSDADEVSGSHNNQRITLSSRGLVKKSVSIRTDTIIGPCGRVQSYMDNGPTYLRKDKKGSKKAAFISAGVPVTYYDVGPPTHQCRNCGATMWYEEREEKSKTSPNPTFTLCCKGGKVLLLRFHDTPPSLDNILSHDQPSTAEFRDNIRVYNSMFSFTSFEAKIDNSINTGRAPYTFRINEQNYHRMGSLLPAEGMPSKFAQLYFLTLGMSSVAQSFRMARDWCNTHSSADFHLRLHSERKTTRQYNAPTVSEVAAIIINDFGDAHPTLDIVVDRKDTGLQRVSELHPSYMALQYPLLFPYEEDDFHDKIPYHANAGTRKTKRGYVTMKEYYSYIIHQRPGQSDTLRVDLYHNLCDAVTRGDTSAVGLGKRIILPKTFTGSPRYMMHNQDAMALCRAYGNPDLFVTFTSNPNWPKILEMLTYFLGQKPHDRPEIGTRVFSANDRYYDTFALNILRMEHTIDRHELRYATSYN
nr:putative PIF1 DNA helicase/replication protein A1-like protein [Tanacetum cinerariifolium]